MFKHVKVCFGCKRNPSKVKRRDKKPEDGSGFNPGSGAGLHIGGDARSTQDQRKSRRSPRYKSKGRGDEAETKAVGGSDPAINPGFHPELKAVCPPNGYANVPLPIDHGSERTFDKQNLQNIKDDSSDEETVTNFENRFSDGGFGHDYVLMSAPLPRQIVTDGN